MNERITREQKVVQSVMTYVRAALFDRAATRRTRSTSSTLPARADPGRPPRSSAPRSPSASTSTTRARRWSSARRSSGASTRSSSSCSGVDARVGGEPGERGEGRASTVERRSRCSTMSEPDAPPIDTPGGPRSVRRASAGPAPAPVGAPRVDHHGEGRRRLLRRRRLYLKASVMADFYQRIESPAGDRLYEHMLKVQAKAVRNGRQDVAEEVGFLIANLRADLRQLAAEAVVLADKRAVHNLAARRKRPETTEGRPPARPGGRARSRSPRSAAPACSAGRARQGGQPERRLKQPYWRSIEYGLDEGFVGRRIFGSFYEPGGPAPRRNRPTGHREHALFRHPGRWRTTNPPAG
jgi:hypothetical protein